MPAGKSMIALPGLDGHGRARRSGAGRAGVRGAAPVPAQPAGARRRRPATSPPAGQARLLGEDVGGSPLLADRGDMGVREHPQRGRRDREHGGRGAGGGPHDLEAARGPGP